ncbi:YghX family hydrolase [Cohaesibacter celericrescens]|uniref:Dienelactone hydrolase n=1 Tax=Cohaesibacter celericrescens TaxID=2067669 RepID=A0A2N5XKE2_9HYPH|nr:YghX family hydrolase [Cohaesibacter celericrescens]PLW74986.1 dienelactone hydrolase [Cohaesibacter celericrescens]
MKRMNASDFHPRLLELYDGYVHGKMSKRAFLTGATRYVAAGVTAMAVLESLQPNYALASQVAEDDADITVSGITYESPDGHGKINGYMAAPAGAAGPLPAVLVVHENRGLNPYIKDVVRRAAKAGFLAMGPDGLTPLGGYPGNDDDGRTMQKKLDSTKLMEDFFAGFEYLVGHKNSTGKVGAVGFCYGGGVCNALAVAYPNMAASVPFYGRQPEASDVPNIKAPLLLHYGALDERVNAGWPAYKAALEKNGKAFEAHIYEGANHGFHNDTTPRFDEAAAKLAWDRTIAFFKANLV